MTKLHLPLILSDLGACGRLGAAIALCLLGAVACTTPADVYDPETGTIETESEAAVETEVPATETDTATVIFADVEGPDNGVPNVENGSVKQLTLPGPAVAVLVTCDQEGFVPFGYKDMGWDWVGCQVPNPGDPVGAGSNLTEPELSDVPSPVGGTVSQVTIPGPQSAIAVVCNQGSPFVYEDQGTWVGCQGS